jgi:putative membrane protein
VNVSALAIAALLLAGPPAHAQTLTDAQIAAIVVTANQVDIDAGELAALRATNAEVRTFAQRMVTDHKAVNQSAIELAAKLKVTPQENDTSRTLKAGGDKNLAALKKASGAAFDRAYVDQEVVYHTQVLEALDKTLIPGAANAELKALLVKVRPAFVAHLEHAKQIQAALKKGEQDSRKPKPVTHTVTIDASSFRPSTLTIVPGDSVVWINKDLIPHTATSQKQGLFDSGTIPAGKSWRRTFTDKADLAYICLFHPTMKGSLRVQPKPPAAPQ